MTDETTDARARELGRRLADATLAAVSDTIEFMRGVHDRDRRLVAEQAAKRVRLRRMHSAYHARRR